MIFAAGNCLIREATMMLIIVMVSLKKINLIWISSELLVGWRQFIQRPIKCICFISMEHEGTIKNNLLFKIILLNNR